MVFLLRHNWIMFLLSINTVLYLLLLITEEFMCNGMKCLAIFDGIMFI